MLSRTGVSCLSRWENRQNERCYSLHALCVTSTRLIKPQKVRLSLSFHQHSTVPQKVGINIFLPFYHSGAGLILALQNPFLIIWMTTVVCSLVSSLTFILVTAARVLSEWGATTPKSADGTCIHLFVSPNYLWNSGGNMWCKQTRHRNDRRKGRNVEEFLEHIRQSIQKWDIHDKHKGRES